MVKQYNEKRIVLFEQFLDSQFRYLKADWNIYQKPEEHTFLILVNAKMLSEMPKYWK